MHRSWFLVAALAACDSSVSVTPDAVADAPVDSPPPFTPATCNGQPITIVASTRGNPVSFGPVTLDLTNTTICVALDARVQYASTFFEAETALEPGTSSSFVLEVRSVTDVLLKQGEDTSFGSMPQAVAYVGLPVDPMQLVPIKLVARAKAVPTETWLRMSLIVPID